MHSQQKSPWRKVEQILETEGQADGIEAKQADALCDDGKITLERTALNPQSLKHSHAILQQSCGVFNVACKQLLSVLCKLCRGCKLAL